FRAALLRAIVFMIVASPCAVVLSTMPPLLAAIANAGRHGVLVKSATVMEQVGRTGAVAFDKTGTLTRGELRVTEVRPAPGQRAERLLALAAAAEHRSEHPVGRAVRAAARERGLPADGAATEFRALPGRGVRAVVDGTEVRVERAGEGAAGPAETAVQVRSEERRVGKECGWRGAAEQSQDD